MLRQFEWECAPVHMHISWNEAPVLTTMRHTRCLGDIGTQTEKPHHRHRVVKHEKQNQADSQINPNQEKRILHTPRASPAW